MIAAANLATMVADLAAENRGLSAERAAIRLRPLIDALQLGQDPEHYLLAIAAIAMAAIYAGSEKETPPQSPARLQ